MCLWSGQIACLGRSKDTAHGHQSSIHRPDDGPYRVKSSSPETQRHLEIQNTPSSTAASLRVCSPLSWQGKAKRWPPFSAIQGPTKCADCFNEQTLNLLVRVIDQWEINARASFIFILMLFCSAQNCYLTADNLQLFLLITES